MATRSSTRLRQKNATLSPNDASPQPPPSPQPPRKRQRIQEQGASSSKTVASATEPARKRTKGKLRAMTEMPMDILFEIFRHLGLGDILHLSLANKSLREFLLATSARSLWEDAFANVQPAPPPCPEGTSMIRYASLLFGRYCFYCGSSNGSLVHWPAKARFCSLCLDEKFQGWKWSSDPLMNLAPLGKVKPARRASVYLEKAFCEQIRQDLNALSDPQAIETYTRQAHQRKQEIIRHARLCEGWQRDRKFKRSQSLDAIRKSRRASIIAKLHDLGWGTELGLLTNMVIDTLPGIKQSKELTERTWTKIKDDIIASLEEIKALRLQREHVALLGARVVMLRSFIAKAYSEEYNSIIPAPHDFLAIQPFRTMVFHSNETELTQDSFDALASQLPDLVASWRSSKDEFLFGLLPGRKSKKRASGTASVETLSLATTFFKCHRCDDPITYPRVLVHQCLTNPPPFVSDTEVHEFYTCQETPVPWSHDEEKVTFDNEASRFATAVIQSGGQDPNSTTADTMDELNLRYECLLCDKGPRRSVMNWKAAILHSIQVHHEDSSKATNWKVLSPDEILVAKAAETKSSPKWRSKVTCAHCHWTIHLHEFGLHMSVRHPKVSPEDGKTEKPYYIPWDTGMHRPPYLVKIPR